MQVRSLREVFAVLRPDQCVDPVDVTPSLYGELDKRYGGFGGHTLFAWHEFSADWNTWECHPAGDEIVLLLSGAATLLVRQHGRNQALPLAAPGDYCIVPAGCWHTARVIQPSGLLFVTPGAGTENREQPPDD